MANLLNVLPQAPSNNVASPQDASFLKSAGQNPAVPESKELKELFQKNLAENLAVKVDGEKLPGGEKAETGDQAQVALAAGAIAVPQIPIAIDVKTAGVPEGVSKEALKNASANAPKNTPNLAQKNAVVGDLKLQIPNRLGEMKTAPDLKQAQAIAQSAKNIPHAQLLASNEAAGIAQPNPMATAELASLMAGQSLLEIPGDHSFEIESLNAKTELPKAASSKLSTSDFLNLREISQNPHQIPVAAKPEMQTGLHSPLMNAKQVPLPASAALGTAIGTKATQNQKQKPRQPQDLAATMSDLAPMHTEKHFMKTMDATVTQAPGQKPALSPESTVQIGNHLNLLGQARQDGEIKIRLRPDHLGELQMSVRTQGQNVSLQITAESNEAKKILEGSLGALREHLSMQNLSLARVDVVAQPASPSNLDQTQMQFDSNQNFNQSSAHQGGREGFAHDQQSSREFYQDGPAYSAPKAPIPIRPRAADASRLDMIA